MPALLIVWHSRTGGAQAMAEAAARAAQEEADVATRLRAAADGTIDDLLAADAYIFAAPENLASLSGTMKEFFDRTYYPALGRIEGRPYAQMICAGSDGTGAARQLARIATGWRLRAVAEPLIVRTAAQTTDAILARKQLPIADLAAAADLGRLLAAGLSMGIF